MKLSTIYTLLCYANKYLQRNVRGAGIALAPEDILAEFSVLFNRKEVGCALKGFEGEEQRKDEGVFEFLDSNPRTVEEILDRMRKKGKNIELTELQTQLMERCMEGEIKQIGGSFVKSHL